MAGRMAKAGVSDGTFQLPLGFGLGVCYSPFPASMRFRWLTICLVAVGALVGLGWRTAGSGSGSGVSTPDSSRPETYQPEICGRASTQFPDFPETYISEIHVDLTSPNHPVTLTWTGPNAKRGEAGPFRSSPGAGRCHLDCDDEGTSRVYGSKCTPKGTHVVQGYNCDFPGPSHTASYIDMERDIALHYHPFIPSFPVSSGCIHLDLHPARLIFDNSRRGGLTKVHVTGQWSRGLDCF